MGRQNYNSIQKKDALIQQATIRCEYEMQEREIECNEWAGGKGCEKEKLLPFIRLLLAYNNQNKNTYNDHIMNSHKKILDLIQQLTCPLVSLSPRVWSVAEQS